VIAAALLLYAVALAITAPRVLARPWTIRHPRAGLVAWHVVTTTVGLSALAAALLAAHDAWTPLAARLLGTGPVADGHPTLGAAVLGHEWNASLLVVSAVTMRVLLIAWRRLRRTHRERAHVSAAVAALAPTGLPAPYQDVSTVTLAEPTAFCIPGRHPKIVISGAALQRLSEDQLGAVVAHERAHLRYRHAAWATWAALWAEAFPRWPLVAAYARAVPRLHEMHADDLAARASGGRVVTASLLALAAPHPSGALAMTGGDVAMRAGRLLAPPQPARGLLACVGVGLGVVLMIPLVLFTGPGLSAVSSAHHPEHGHVATHQGS
jgi:Zn-dependent protease with chaperone function